MNCFDKGSTCFTYLTVLTAEKKKEGGLSFVKNIVTTCISEAELNIKCPVQVYLLRFNIVVMLLFTSYEPCWFTV